MSASYLLTSFAPNASAEAAWVAIRAFDGLHDVSLRFKSTSGAD